MTIKQILQACLAEGMTIQMAEREVVGIAQSLARKGQLKEEYSPEVVKTAVSEILGELS